MYAKWGHSNFVAEWNAAILAIEAEALAEPGPELTMKEKGWREAAFQVGYNRGADEARASLDEPPRIVTLAWDATAEDVARIRRDWDAAAEAPAPLDVERLARALGSVVPEPDDEHEYTVTDDLWYAAAIAREYAKEQQP